MRNLFKKTAAWVAGLGLAFSQASAAIDTTLVTDTDTALQSLSSSAKSLFEGVVPVVLAAAGIGILLSMIKFIKKR